MIRLYYIGLNTVNECIRRIQNRVEKGGHNIPDEDVSRRFSSLFDCLIRILPYCDEGTLFDNENGFAEVATYKNGDLVSMGNYCPPWLRELSEQLQAK